jgi:hypothetical protein
LLAIIAETPGLRAAVREHFAAFDAASAAIVGFNELISANSSFAAIGEAEDAAHVAIAAVGICEKAVVTRIQERIEFVRARLNDAAEALATLPKTNPN